MTIGSQSITVNSLGRQCSYGNSSAHELRLIRVSDNSVVGNTTVAMAGCAVGQFKYGNLSNPVTLSANTSYILVSYEVGGDLFHDWTNTVLTTMSVATINHGVYTVDGGQTWGVAGSTGNSYVPLDLKYQVPPNQPFVTGKTLAAQRSDSPGWTGFEMSIGAQPITVTNLGRYCSAGNSLTHELRIIRSSDNATLASVNVAMSGCTAGTTKYAVLATSVTLSANTAYRLVSYEVGSDLYHDWTGLYLSTTSAAAVLHGVYTTDGGQTWGPAGGTGNSYVPLDFQYQTTSVTGVDLRWLVTDQLGTPHMVLDQTGSLANMSRHDYLPFGEELFAGTGGRTTAQGYSASDGVRQQFTQKERDTETGLDYFGARYFASTQGRFTSADPLLASGRAWAPQSWNRYSYVLNNPLRLNDPTGLIDDDPQKKKDEQPQPPPPPPIKVKVDVPPAQVFTNEKLPDGKYMTGVGSQVTVTLTDANDKPLAGATVSESNKAVPGQGTATGEGPRSIVQNESTVTTSPAGTLKDYVVAGTTTTTPDFGKSGETVEGFKDYINETKIDRITEQTLTVKAVDGNSYQVTYQRTVTNVGPDGRLNEKVNANGVNVVVTTTTPVIKRLP